VNVIEVDVTTTINFANTRCDAACTETSPTSTFAPTRYGATTFAWLAEPKLTRGLWRA
jgi:hypothetical protein